MATITRQAQWEKNYEKNRYLEMLSEEDLIGRLKSIHDNWITVTFDADFSPQIVPIESKEDPLWLELQVHTVHEFRLRGIGPQQAMTMGGAADIVSRIDFDKRQPAFARTSMTESTFKLGDVAHLEPMLLNGDIRICPATYYGRGGYGEAIDDNEMEKFINLNHRNSDISGLLDGFKLHDFIKYDIKIPIIAPTDYYLFCMSRTFRPRHLYDFGYNACLHIRDRQKFIRRFRTAWTTRFGKDYEIYENTVRYVDPLRPRNGDKFVAMSMKHFKFSYQTEFRLCMTPKIKTDDLGAPIFLSLGPLTDIAELIPFA